MNARAKLAALILVSVAVLLFAGPVAASTTLTWTTRADMPTPRLQMGVAAASNGNIYALGGVASPGGTRLDTLEEYDPAADVWTPRTSMTGARFGLGLAATSNGNIYAIGGGGPIGVCIHNNFCDQRSLTSTRRP